MKRKLNDRDETSRQLQELLADIEALLARREQRAMDAAAATTPTQPEQTATEDAPACKLPTAKMRQALARFDDLADADQVDYLTTLWGQS